MQLFISPFLEQLCLENMETLVHRKISRAFSLVSCRYKELGHAFINCELWHVKLHAGSPTVPLFSVFLVRGNSVRPTIPNSCISLTPFRLRHGYDIDNLQCFPLWPFHLHFRSSQVVCESVPVLSMQLCLTRCTHSVTVHNNKGAASSHEMPYWDRQTFRNVIIIISNPL